MYFLFFNDLLTYFPMYLRFFQYRHSLHTHHVTVSWWEIHKNSYETRQYTYLALLLFFHTQGTLRLVRVHQFSLTFFFFCWHPYGKKPMHQVSVHLRHRSRTFNVYPCVSRFSPSPAAIDLPFEPTVSRSSPSPSEPSGYSIRLHPQNPPNQAFRLHPQNTQTLSPTPSAFHRGSEEFTLQNHQNPRFSYLPNRLHPLKTWIMQGFSKEPITIHPLRSLKIIMSVSLCSSYRSICQLMRNPDNFEEKSSLHMNFVIFHVFSLFQWPFHLLSNVSKILSISSLSPYTSCHCVLMRNPQKFIQNSSIHISCTFTFFSYTGYAQTSSFSQCT